MRERVPTVMAILIGFVVLLGYFLRIPVLDQFRNFMVDLAATLAAIALLVGILNLARVHGGKVLEFKNGWPYSLTLLGGLGTILLVWALSYVIPGARQYVIFIFTYVQTPLEATLGALLAFILVASGIRLIRVRLTTNSVIFVAVTLILLFGLISFRFIPEVLPEIRGWIIQVPAVAGARGIILGLALGAIATGLRVLIGADRPYGE